MMANGYIHPVADGEITELRDFLLKNSYAMMALVTMRDADQSKDPPRKLEPDFSYYADRLKEKQDYLDKLATMTDAEREAVLDAEYNEAMANAKKFDAQSVIEIQRVVDMRDKVAAWEGGPDGYKAFLLKQLDDAIEHNDADYSATKYVKRQSFEDAWRKAIEDVGKCHGEIAAETARTVSRNRWLSDLWASVDALN